VPESLSQFFAMGGYGAFVWSAFAITFIVLLANVLASRWVHKSLVKRLQRERQLNAAMAKESGRQGHNNSVRNEAMS